MKKTILIMLITSMILQPANIIKSNTQVIGDNGELPFPDPILIKINNIQ